MSDEFPIIINGKTIIPNIEEEKCRDTMRHVDRYDPDWVSPTGDTIQDILDERGWTTDDFAVHMEITHEESDKMISGIDPIYPPTCILLQNVLGGTVSFWLNREMNYRIKLRRKGITREACL